MGKALADPGGAPGARPPLTAADLWVFYAQNANFTHFFSSIASLAIDFKYNFNRNMAINMLKLLLLQPLTLSMIFYPPPSPVDKVHPPPKVKSWIRHWKVSSNTFAEWPMHVLCIMFFKFFNFVGMTTPESTTRCEHILSPRNRKTSALDFFLLYM